MIAVLSTPPPSPAAVPAGQDLRDIAPPVDVFPYPLWMVVVAACVVLTVLGLLVWWIVATIRRRPPPMPPSPRSVALAALNRLRSKVQQVAPYDFSIEVSDVLRSYVAVQYEIHATAQTSPEFLSAISGSPKFAEADRSLLADFLERCDLIKFARADADSRENERLLQSALDFVKGGQLA